jgi:hypothetical protein
MANNKSAIKVDDLKTVIDAIFAHLKDDLGIDEIALTKDYYWDVPESSLYSVDRDMEAPTIGSLFDDLEFLNPLLQNREQAVSLMLLHVAPLLRYIANKVGQ